MSTDTPDNQRVRPVIGAADIAAYDEDWDRTEAILKEALSRTRRRKLEALRNDDNDS